jgi:hypothetical protein
VFLLIGVDAVVFPLPIVRVESARCGRFGRYRPSLLLSRFGGGAALQSLCPSCVDRVIMVFWAVRFAEFDQVAIRS